MEQKLRVIEGERTAGPRAGRRRSLESTEQVTCYKCEAEGVATSAVIAVTLAPRRRPDGKKTGGTRVWACAYCLSKGIITELIRG